MTLKSLPETEYGRMLARGRTYDYEDSLVTYRLHTALKVLATVEVVPTITHGTRTYYDWCDHRDKHQCSLDGSGYGDCTISWPEWATGAMFDEAVRLAGEAHRERGAYNRSKAYAAR